MKIRNGFVSNSSSSSFVIDKRVLTEDQINDIKSFFDKYRDCGESSFLEDDDSFYGTIESHFGPLDSRHPTYKESLNQLLESFGYITPSEDTVKWYDFMYEGDATLTEREYW